MAPSAVEVKVNSNYFTLTLMEEIYIKSLEECTIFDPVVSVLDYFCWIHVKAQKNSPVIP